MGVPLEVVASPFEVWIAPVGEAFPLIDAVPAGNWVKIGTGGNRNITEDGVIVTHNQTVENFRALGSTGPIKAFRTEVDFMISFNLADYTLENYSYAMNFNVVTDNPAGSGIAGFREMDIWMGFDVEQRALLVRGQLASPYLEGAPIQYEVPVVSEQSSKELTNVKGTPIALALEFMAIEDPNAASNAKRFGTIKMMDENPS